MALSLQDLALILTLSTAAVSLGCSSSGSVPATSDPASSSPATSGTPATSNAGGAPTFTNVYRDILGPICTACHTPGGEAPFLDMSTQTAAYTNLVGVKADGTSCAGSGLTRVVPGDAAESLLYEKVSEATPPCGSQMPLGCSGQSCLSSTHQTEIEDWINGGALNN
jgi:hypothetical protein